MKQVIYEPKEEMIAWAESKIEDGRFRDDAKAIGLRSEVGLLAVAVFDAFTTTGCWISIASDGSRNWLTREFILKVFCFPFLQIGYPRLNAFVSVDNRASRQFCEGFGFKEEGRMREAGNHGEDLIMFGMLRSECRWLPSTFAGKTGKPVI